MKRILFFTIFAFVTLAALFTYQYFKFHDGKLHIVFCDVGQGDGILIITPSNKHIMIDAGPDSKIIDCLSEHMAFWERVIDVAIITHPHADHFMGYYYVIDRYRIDQFATEALSNKSAGFEGLMKRIDERGIPKQLVYKGDRWRVPSYAKASDGKGDVIIAIAGPTKEFLERKDPDGVIDNSAESASLATLVGYGNFSALLTGDAPVDEMQEIAEGEIGEIGEIRGLDILQIPHHGSNTGIDEGVLDELAPHMAIISVGKNSYGHPTKRVLDLLAERGIKPLRTDQLGDIELVSDGKNTWLN